MALDVGMTGARCDSGAQWLYKALCEASSYPFFSFSCSSSSKGLKKKKKKVKGEETGLYIPKTLPIFKFTCDCSSVRGLFIYTFDLTVELPCFFLTFLQ